MRLLIALIFLVAATAQTPDPVGTWEGPLEAGGMRLRLALHLSAAEDGSLKATIDSIDQGVKGIPVPSVSWMAPRLRLSLPALGANFDGKLDDAGKAFDGTWSQSGQQTPLRLKRVAEATKLNRPQTPQGPFPYREQPVTIKNDAAGVELAGTLTLPEAERGRRFPAALLITGSGPQDRDETIFEHKPFLVIADYLTRRGYAVLRVDDRGVGRSTGDFRSATTKDFASDAAVSLAFLRARAEIDSARVGLIGHSEGAIVASMIAATQPKDVSFLILLAAPGVPTRDGLIEQGEALLKASGAPAEAIRRQREVQEAMFPLLLTDKGSIELKPLIEEKLGVANLPASGRAVADVQIAQSLSPWFREYLAIDPATYLAKVRCPVLALNGEKDTQVVAASNLKAIGEALTRSGNKNHEEMALAGLNHLFQPSQTGTPAEYGTIEQTMSPEVLARISKWLDSILKR